MEKSREVKTNSYMLRLCSRERSLKCLWFLCVAVVSLSGCTTGTVYQKYEPVFFQSIGNPFIFRCLDGILIDGNDKGISKVVYR